MVNQHPTWLSVIIKSKPIIALTDKKPIDETQKKHSSVCEIIT